MKWFNLEVNNYKKEIRKQLKKFSSLEKNKSVILFSDIEKKSFFSVAALSKAFHDLNFDFSVIFSNDPQTKNLLFTVWNESPEFIDKSLRKAPLLLFAGKTGFFGNFDLPFSKFNLEKHPKLKLTCEKIWKNVFNPKKGENIGVWFELVPKNLENVPLKDYLDNFLICYEMISLKKDSHNLEAKASTRRTSINESPERISELLITLMGFELSKWSEEVIFKKYSSFAKKHKIRPRFNDLVFGISGKGYSGKHLFGQKVGYPVKTFKNKVTKLRWDSPSGIIYKFPWYPQSEFESRPPKCRIGFTQTIPMTEFIQTCNIDWSLMRQKNKFIQNILKKAEKVHVKSNLESGKRSDFWVYYRRKDGSKQLRGIKRSDGDVRNLINLEMKKETGKEFGVMANIPAGESFLTPENVFGTIVGDVVICIDDSYELKTPLVIEAFGKEYRIKSGSKKVISALNKNLKDAKKRIDDMEKHKVLPKKLIDQKRENFMRIGEFAINTNDKASLSRYLIVNEKIANMIHIALGSGFDPDTNTTYHYDTVIDCKKQKLDVTTVSKSGKEYPIIKNGKLLIDL